MQEEKCKTNLNTDLKPVNQKNRYAQNIRLVALVFILGGGFFGASFFHAQFFPDLSPEYGILNVKVSSTQEVYFKREIRGLNYDVIVLSSDQNPCKEPHPNVDFIQQGLDPEFLYKLDGDTLHIFNTTQMSTPNTFPIKVIQYELSNPAYIQMKNDYKQHGVRILEVKRNQKIICF